MKSTDNILRHTRSAPGRNSTVSPERLMVERHLQQHLNEPLTNAQICTATGLPRNTVSNVTSQLRRDGKARTIGQAAGHPKMVWYTSNYERPTLTPEGAAPPRTYVNAAMPNGSAEYWRKAMAWGR
jgi:hypothetical protein